MKVQLDAIESESACRGAKLNKKITFHAQKHFFLADKMHLRYFVSLVAINNRINSPACLFIFFSSSNSKEQTLSHHDIEPP